MFLLLLRSSLTVGGFTDELADVERGSVVEEDHLEVEDQDELYLDLIRYLDGVRMLLTLGRIVITAKGMQHLEDGEHDRVYNVNQQVRYSHHQ